jgi:RND family efflux transporter MFP subunit
VNDHLAADLASLRIDRAPKPPRRGLGVVLGAVVGVGALGAAVVMGRPYVESRVFRTEVEVTEISAISPAQAEVDITATGYVIPQSTAKVAAKIVGRVSKVAVHEGSTVKAGDVLFELDPDDQNAAIAAAQARAAAAAARIATARANAVEVDLEYRRSKKLVESGAASRAEAENTKARLDSLAAQISAAQAEAHASQAEVHSLSTGAKNLKITAPIDGTVMSKPASVGDVVNPGQPLVELANFATLLVEVDVPEGRLGKVKLDAPCEIVLDAFTSERFPGKVVEVGPRLNRAKATALVKVKFDKPPTELRPEMSARVSFLQKALDEKALKAPDKIVVPKAALFDRNGEKAVWIIEDGKVKVAPVKLGEPLGAGFILESGPPPKTRLVKDPPQNLADGQPVKEKSAT